MIYTDSTTIDFIRSHTPADTNRLLLSAKKYSQIEDMQYVVDQIIGRNQIRDKLPLYYGNKDIVIPSRIAAEQCSSVQTALYKQSLLEGDSLCDLTGGFGVDSYYFALKTKKSFYIERFENYCEVAKHNFNVLGIEHIEVINGDCQSLDLPCVDTFYIDPARRGDNNKRLFSIEDCEPNIVEMRTMLLAKSKRLVIKVSPMADLVQSLKLLPETKEVHVISVKNDCKELLFVLDNEPVLGMGDIPITCVNFLTNGEMQSFTFTLNEESVTETKFYHNTEVKYLYEPNASLMKAGAFKQVSYQLGLLKLHPHSHLYVSEQLVENFPGRTFEINSCIDFSSKTNKNLHKDYPKANIATRNFPLQPDALRKKLKISEGGEIYLFATTFVDNQKKLILGKKI